MIHKNTLNTVCQNDQQLHGLILSNIAIFVVNVGDALQKCYFSAGLKALDHVLLM